MQANASRTPLNWLLLLFLVCAWGSSFALTKVAVASIPPIWVAATRIAIGALIASIIYLLQKGLLPRTLRAWMQLTWLGLLGNVIPFLLISWGTTILPSGVSGILMAAVPLWVLLLAFLFLADENLTWMKILGFLTGFVGVAWLFDIKNLLSLSFEGDMLLAQGAILLATLSYGATSISARLMTKLEPTQKAIGSLITAALCILPIAFWQAPDGLSSALPEAWISVSLLGLVATGLAALVLYALLERAGATFTAISNYLIPPFAVLTGWLFLEEAFGQKELTGMGLILLGILLSQIKPRIRQTA